ncbi:MAG: methyltransferase [Rhizobiales bacterium 62-47]|nr:methyltransferase [Hyphomicrobiales bacterium]OJY11636.1 MAG: methyltransferase [Rhizobiales bacterium 62-47]
MSSPPDAVTDDTLLGGRLRLRQPASGHRAGHDAMLLAASVAVRPGERVVDFGAGVGAAGLAVAQRARDIDLVLVEIDPALAGLASVNASSNGIAAEVLTLDVSAGAAVFAAAGLGPDSADVVLMNPPFNDRARQQSSHDRSRRLAHMATATTLEDWVHAARRILKPGGALTMIWRAEAIKEVLAALDRGFGSIALQPVHGVASQPAIRILVRAIKGGGAPMQILPAVMLNDAAGVPNEMTQAVLAGDKLLPLAAR